MKIHECKDISVRKKNYVRAPAAIPAIGLGKTHILIAIKASATPPAITAFNKDLCLVYKRNSKFSFLTKYLLT
jgi:hypothetical protein